MKKVFYILSILAYLGLYAETPEIAVKITKDIPYVDVVDSGTKVRVERIQDTQNRLTDDFAKTSRVCPPHCIVPIAPYKEVKNVEELEVISFMQEEVANNTGLLVDAREPTFYNIETLPTAINIPFSILEVGDKSTYEQLFSILSVSSDKNGKHDYSKAKKLIVFCSGVWCQASSKLIIKMVEHGYPKEKLFFYRSGLQGWKLLGLTTVIRKENTK